MECHPISDPTHKIHQDHTSRILFFSCIFLSFKFAHPKFFFAGCLFRCTCAALNLKYKSQTAETEEEKSKNPKVYFSRFDLLNSCRMPFQLNMRNLKYKSQTVLREEKQLKSRNVKKHKRNIDKSKNKKKKLFTFLLSDFWPDAFPAEHAQFLFSSLGN